jgi:hypothetical protein
MHCEIVELTLADRDLYLTQIESQINAKRKLLMDKKKILKKELNQNEFLKYVMNDYNKYYQYIIQQKQDQINAMNTLKSYINDIIVSGKMTDQDIENARKEKNLLLNELNKIRHELESINNEIKKY